MPYITQHMRDFLKEHPPTNSGSLNYLLTQICQQYIEASEISLNYRTINEIVGALECAKLEFYRRMAVPYEDKKIAENGDVYEVTS